MVDPSFLADVNTSILPRSSGAYDLGSSSLKWKNLYLAGAGDLGSLKIAGTEVITSGRILQNIASVSQALIPTSDTTYDLGSSTYRWSQGYFSNTVHITRDSGEAILELKTEDGGVAAIDAYANANQLGSLRIRTDAPQLHIFLDADNVSNVESFTIYRNNNAVLSPVESMFRVDSDKSITVYGGKIFNPSRSESGTIYGLQTISSTAHASDILKLEQPSDTTSPYCTVLLSKPSYSGDLYLRIYDTDNSKDAKLRCGDISCSTVYSYALKAGSYLYMKSAFADPNTFGLIHIIPYDNTKNAILRMFRDTNTSGAVEVHFFKGDGTATKTVEIDAKNGNIWCSSYGDFSSLKIGGAEVITSGRVLQHINYVDQSLLPTSSGTYDLGSSSYKWYHGYFSSYVYAGGIDTNGGIIANTGSIYPKATNTYNLGSSIKKWETVYRTNETGCPLPTSNSAINVMKKIKKPKVTDGDYGHRHYFQDDDLPDEMKFVNDDGKKTIELTRTLGVCVQAIREIIERLEVLESKIAV